MLIDAVRSARQRAHARLAFACCALSALSSACELEIVGPYHEDARAPAEAVDASAPPDAEPRSEPEAGHDAGTEPDAGETLIDAGIAAEDATQPALDAADSALELDAATASDAALDGGALVSEAGNLEAGSGDAAAGSDAAIPPAPGLASKQLVAGRAHACSLDPAISDLLCWGDNTFGQTTVPALNGPTFVAAGGDVTCAIDKSGDVSCWGDNAHHQRDVPWLLARATQVAVGAGHVCALSVTGRVRCWGDDSAGQLQVPALDNVRSIGAGAQHSCALAADGVHCWGDDAQGQRNVPALSGVTQLAVGGFHNCVLASGAVQCWGGDVPALRDDIPRVSAPTALAAGRSHSCVIDGGSVRCWGDPSAQSLAPRELTWPRQIAVGGAGSRAFACARHLQGVACWGDDTQHQTDYDGSPSHQLYRAEAEIDAPPALVWDVLMDLPKYGLWNPYTIAMKSTLKIGDPMVMTVVMNPLLTLEQSENIRVLEPGHKACWGIDTDTPDLNAGERCQWLEPLPSGGTRYVTEDLIEGSLNFVVLGLFDDDLQSGFDGVARGLKTRAEALAK